MVTSIKQFVGQIEKPGFRPENVNLTIEERPQVTSSEKAAGVIWVDGRYDPGDVRRYGAKPDDSTVDDTDAILKAFTVAQTSTQGKVFFANGTYKISSSVTPISSAAWTSLDIIGDKAKIEVDAGSTAFAYAMYVNSTTNMEFNISGLEIDCNNLCANGLHVDVRDTSPSTLTAQGTCNISGLRIYDVKKESTVTAAASGITVIGAFATTNIFDNDINLVFRANHASLGNECKGIAVSDAMGVVNIFGNRIEDVQTPTVSDADGDGISVFGRGGATGFREGSANIYNNEIRDCRGRHVKVQTSTWNVYSNKIWSEDLAMIAQSVSIDGQFGNGHVYDNDIYYKENSGGSSNLGTSHSVIAAQNILTDHEQITSVHDNHVYSEVQFPNFIAFSNASEFATINAHDNIIRPIEDLGPDGNIINRAFLEFDDDSLATDDGVVIKCNNNTFSGLSGSRLIGYTGHNGTDDLDAKLFIEAVNNENRGDNTCRVFDSLSGSDITLIEGLKIWGNVNMGALFSNLNTDLDALPEGTDICIDLATATLANGPSSLPSTGTARVVTGSNANTSTWHPTVIHLEDGTQWWQRVSNTWRVGQLAYRTGSGSPSGSVTPNFIGEEWLDTTGNAWYKAYGTGNTNWQAL